MIHLKEEIFGVDEKIQKAQTKIYNFLNENVKSYGRVVDIERNKKVIPTFNIKGTDFREVLPSKKGELKGCTFFSCSDVTDFRKGRFYQEVSIIFIVDVFEKYPTKKDVANELFKKDVVTFIDNLSWFEKGDLKVVEGKKALSGYHSDLENLQPYYLLKVSGEVKYYINC